MVIGWWCRGKTQKIRVNYGQGKSLSNNAPTYMGIAKIKGIDVSIKGISGDNKTSRTNQLNVVSNK